MQNSLINQPAQNSFSALYLPLLIVFLTLVIGGCSSEGDNSGGDNSENGTIEINGIISDSVNASRVELRSPKHEPNWVWSTDETNPSRNESHSTEVQTAEANDLATLKGEVLGETEVDEDKQWTIKVKRSRIQDLDASILTLHARAEDEGFSLRSAIDANKVLDSSSTYEGSLTRMSPHTEAAVTFAAIDGNKGKKLPAIMESLLVWDEEGNVYGKNQALNSYASELHQVYARSEGGESVKKDLFGALIRAQWPSHVEPSKKVKIPLAGDPRFEGFKASIANGKGINNHHYTEGSFNVEVDSDTDAGYMELEIEDNKYGTSKIEPLAFTVGDAQTVVNKTLAAEKNASIKVDEEITLEVPSDAFTTSAHFNIERLADLQSDSDNENYDTDWYHFQVSRKTASPVTLSYKPDSIHAEGYPVLKKISTTGRGAMTIYPNNFEAESGAYRFTVSSFSKIKISETNKHPLSETFSYRDLIDDPEKWLTKVEDEVIKPLEDHIYDSVHTESVCTPNHNNKTKEQLSEEYENNCFDFGARLVSNLLLSFAKTASHEEEIQDKLSGKKFGGLFGIINQKDAYNVYLDLWERLDVITNQLAANPTFSITHWSYMFDKDHEDRGDLLQNIASKRDGDTEGDTELVEKLGGGEPEGGAGEERLYLPMIAWRLSSERMRYTIDNPERMIVAPSLISYLKSEGDSANVEKACEAIRDYAWSKASSALGLAPKYHTGDSLEESRELSEKALEKADNLLEDYPTSAKRYKAEQQAIRAVKDGLKHMQDLYDKAVHVLESSEIEKPGTGKLGAIGDGDQGRWQTMENLEPAKLVDLSDEEKKIYVTRYVLDLVGSLADPKTGCEKEHNKVKNLVPSISPEVYRTDDGDVEVTWHRLPGVNKYEVAWCQQEECYDGDWEFETVEGRSEYSRRDWDWEYKNRIHVRPVIDGVDIRWEDDSGDGDGGGNSGDDNNSDGDSNEEQTDTDITEGLVLHYPFNGDAEDASGNNLHASLENGADFGQGRSGDDDQALMVDGNDEYAVSQRSGLLRTPRYFTVSAWIKISDFDEKSSRAIAAQGTFYDTTGNWQFFVREEKGLILSVNNSGSWEGGTDPGSIRMGSSLPTDQWTHVAATFDHSEVSFYVDGQLEKTGTLGATAFNNTDDAIKIGEREYSHAENDFEGSIDDFRLYDRALSEEEVTSLSEAENSISSEQVWQLTTDQYRFDADHRAICQEEFGDDYEVAEWNDLSRQNLDDFFNAVGATDRGDIGFMTREGEQFHNSSRSYLVARHNGDVPTGWLDHDDIDDNRASLGSWYSSRQVVCRKISEGRQ